MKRTTPILIVVCSMISLTPIGLLATWMARRESLGSYAPYVLFFMLFLALATLIYVPFATRAWAKKPTDSA